MCTGTGQDPVDLVAHLSGELKGAHAGSARLRVDLDALHGICFQQDGALERPHRIGAVPRPPRRNSQAALASEADGGGDVLLVGRKGDDDGALVEKEIERLPRLIPAPFAGCDEGP
jgi:hypothetical protein